MYGSWTENVVLWRNFWGFISDLENVLMMYNYWVWAQSRIKNHPFGWLRFENWFFKLLNNDDKKCIKNSTVN